MNSSGPSSGLVDVSDGQRRAVSRLEIVTFLHVAGLMVFTTWDFGGETDFARTIIAWWGSLALVILGVACMRRWRRCQGLPSAVRWLWPLGLFNLLVVVSAQNPSFTRSIIGGTAAFINSGAKPGWPSSAQPVLSLRALWQFDAIFLSCFNLAVVVTRRRLLRGLLFVLTVNALALAVMGTFQKLGRSPGLYFGLQPSPNSQFFATFIYHNHWGAFAVMATAAALGLLFHYARNRGQDGQRYSPAFFGLVATLFIAATVPLSGSRSCSLLILTLLAVAFLCWIRNLLRIKAGVDAGLGDADSGRVPTAANSFPPDEEPAPPSEQHRNAQLEWRSIATAAALATAVFLSGIGGIYLLDRPVIETRLDTTRQQVEDLRQRGDFGGRQQLYADTWHMARDKLCFGWGLASYATVFGIYNSQYAVEPWFGQTFYAEAHSDWLQSVAEVGLTGTGLLVLLGVLPLIAVLRLHASFTELPLWLLFGCGLIALYAWIEFPFANPAVMLVFWLCFFTAIRYHKLTAGAAPFHPQSLPS